MAVFTEEIAVLFQGQYVGIGIHAGFVHLVQADQFVANLVRGVGEHKHDLLRAHGDTPQADGKAVPAQDREDDAHGSAAALRTDVRSDILHGGVIALGTGNNGLGDGNDIPVTQFKSFFLRSQQDAVRHDGGQVIALADDGAADAAGNGADSSGALFHTGDSFPGPSGEDPHSKI